MNHTTQQRNMALAIGCRAITGIFAAVLVAASAWAQDDAARNFPIKPIRIIIGLRCRRRQRHRHAHHRAESWRKAWASP